MTNEALPGLLDKTDFLREFGKHMLHNMKQKVLGCENGISTLTNTLKRQIDSGMLIEAMHTQLQLERNMAELSAWEMAIAFLNTSTRGMGLDPEELNI